MISSFSQEQNQGRVLVHPSAGNQTPDPPVLDRPEQAAESPPLKKDLIAASEQNLEKELFADLVKATSLKLSSQIQMC